jgi:hypothetical protein
MKVDARWAHHRTRTRATRAFGVGATEPAARASACHARRGAVQRLATTGEEPLPRPRRARRLRDPSATAGTSVPLCSTPRGGLRARKQPRNCRQPGWLQNQCSRRLGSREACRREGIRPPWCKVTFFIVVRPPSLGLALTLNDEAHSVKSRSESSRWIRVPSRKRVSRAARVAR